MPRVIMDDGAEINYFLDDFTNPWDEQDETILIHPGSGENSRFYVPLAYALSRKYRVLRLDARGRGESTVPLVELPSSEKKRDTASNGDRYIQDALCLIDHLNIRQVHWFGVASGGVLGVIFATSYPNRVKSLILCNSPSRLPDSLKVSWSLGEKDVATAIEKLGTSEWERRTNVALGVIGSSGADTKFKAWAITQRQKIPTDAYSSFYRWLERFDIFDRLGGINVPTLILASEQNLVASLEEQYIIHRKIPNSKIIVFKEPSIHITLPDYCADVVIRFIKDIAEQKGHNVSGS